MIGNGKTFKQFCFTRRVTKAERVELAWHLVSMRTQSLAKSLGLTK
jgi:hypothetical protein